MTAELLSVLTGVVDVLEWLLSLPGAVFHGYSSLIRWAADSVHSLYEAHGYWVIFLGTLTENTLLVGLIVPGVLVVILAGINAADDALSWPLAIGLGVSGTVIGDTLSYCLGRFGWSRLRPDHSLRESIDRVREPILRRGTLFVLVYHFAGYTRLVGPASAGILRMPYMRWAPADYAGATLWVSTYLGLGYGLGKLGLTLDSTDRYFRYIEWGLLVVVAVAGYYVFRAAQRSWYAHHPSMEEGERRDKAAKETEPDPTRLIAEL